MEYASNYGSKALNSNKFACLENMSMLDTDKRIPSPQLSGSRSMGPREYGRDYNLPMTVGVHAMVVVN